MIKDMVLNLFPEINEISDENLKKKTISTWVKAIKDNKWGQDDLENMPFTLLLDNIDINLIDHTRAVTQIAISIAKSLKNFHGDRIKIDMDIVISGAILHDVGKLYEYKKENNKIVKSELGEIVRHPISGASISYSEGLPFEIVHTIASHSKEGEFSTRSVEAIIIHHADFLNFEPFKNWG